MSVKLKREVVCVCVRRKTLLLNKKFNNNIITFPGIIGINLRILQIKRKRRVTLLEIIQQLDI